MILAAEDSEDLQLLSARLQDAAGKLKNFAWLPKQRRFACVVNRYRWEDSKGPRGSRVRSGLRFDSVLNVQSQNIKRGAPEAIVSLLAIKFIAYFKTDSSAIFSAGRVRAMAETSSGSSHDLPRNTSRRLSQPMRNTASGLLSWAAP